MKKILFLIIIIITTNCFSQISFDEGYFINNSGQKIECLIKNVDWRNNPTNFQYKLSQSTQPVEASLDNVKEFGIFGDSKFVRKNVKIDRSTEETNRLSKDRNPIFKEEQLFLRVLTEGKATLLSYIDTGLRRYFYKKGDSNIEQLVYKKYETSNGKLGVNNFYKQQLFQVFKCSSITLEHLENLKYKRNNLTKIFTDYNSCIGSDTKSYKEEKKIRGLFNLTIRPHLNSSSLTFDSTVNTDFSVDFGNKFGVGFGVEAEFILPFNQNKFAIIIEPTYQSFRSKKTISITRNSTLLDPDTLTGQPVNKGDILTAEVDYNSLEIPLGFRHYFFLNNKSKVFINISYLLDIPLKNLTQFKRADDSVVLTYDDVESQTNFAFGAGYKFNDKIGFELRYQTSREVIDANRALQSSDYETLSVIFGYSLF